MNLSNIPFLKHKTASAPAADSAQPSLSVDANPEFFAYKDGLRRREMGFTVFFTMLCVIDLLLDTSPEIMHTVLKSFTGIALAGMMLNSRFEVPELFTKLWQKALVYLPFVIWCVVFPVLFHKNGIKKFGDDFKDYFGWLTGYQDNPLAGNMDVSNYVFLFLNIAIFGFIVIRLIETYAVKRCLPGWNWIFAGLYAATMLLMILSKNDATWPALFLFIFLCFYLTNYTRDDLSCMIRGMIHGILWAFFIFLVFSLEYRMFCTPGYAGMYVHYNKNALMTLMAHTAALCKWYEFHRENKGTFWKALAAFTAVFIFTYGLLTTVFLTACLMVINTIAVVTLIYFNEKENRIRNTVIRAVLLPLTCLLLFNSCYGFVRQTSALFGTPLIYSTENRALNPGLHPVANDERFTEKDELLTRLKGEFLKYSDPDLQENKKNLQLIRKGTIKAYATRLNLMGHPEEDSMIWINDWYFAQHATVIFLQFLFNFGIPAGLLFMGVCGYALYWLFRGSRKYKKAGMYYIIVLINLATILVYGCFDKNWEYGQMTLTLLFILFYFVMQKEPFAGGKKKKE